jgi:hypothetical protein
MKHRQYLVSTKIDYFIPLDALKLSKYETI